MWQREKIDSCLYSGQILSPIASCRSVSLRFSFYHQPLWLPGKRENRGEEMRAREKYATYTAVQDEIWTAESIMSFLV